MHIEHQFEDWNAPNSRKANFLESGVEVLKSSLGRFWPLVLLVLIAVMMLPTIIFVIAGKVRFDPALFVTEWLHLTIEGVFVFFILEIVRHRSLSSASRKSLIAFVSLNYLEPIQDLIHSLRNSQETVGVNGRTDYLETMTDAMNAWTIIEHALSDVALNHLPKNAAVVVWLISNRNALDLQRCAAILRSLNAGNRNEEEVRELLQRLDRFRAAANRLCGEG